MDHLCCAPGCIVRQMAKAQWSMAPFDNLRYVDLSFNEESALSIPPWVRNKQYNRFMDVLPNPKSRVILPCEDQDATVIVYTL